MRGGTWGAQLKFPVCIVFGPSQSAHCTKTGFVVNCLVCTCSMFASQAPCHQYLSSASVVRHWYVLSGRTFQMAQLAQLGVVIVCKVCIVTRMISVQIWLPADVPSATASTCKSLGAACMKTLTGIQSMLSCTMKSNRTKTWKGIAQ